MKRFESLCLEYCKRMAKAWDYYCVASDGYVAGYKQAREDALKLLTSYKYQDIDSYFNELKNLGEEQVEVVLKDGEHQLSVATFEKWRKNEK